MSKVPVGAHVRDPLFGTWQRVTGVVRVRDGSGNIRLTLADGRKLTAGPNEPVEVRDAVPADLMRAAELAAYEALKEDHREPTALWNALIYYAVATVLPLHERQVRAAIATAIQDADDACGAPAGVCGCCWDQRGADAAIARGDGAESEPQQGRLEA
jgi:hypothetical protein